MIKVKFIFKNKDTGEESDYPDEANVTSLETAEQEIKELLEQFNETERHRYGDEKTCREFVRLLDEEPTPQHEWYKMDLVSGAVTKYKCQRCMLIEEFHFPHVPHGGDCHPERVCEYCNEEYVSEKNLQRHQIKKYGMSFEEEIK